MAAPAAPPTPNLFGLTQYDNLASFFGDQNFDYNGFVLPSVRTPQRKGSAAVGTPGWRGQQIEQCTVLQSSVLQK